MARKNRFSSKVVKPVSNRSDETTFDGLPQIKFDSDGLSKTNITKSNGSKAILVFSNEKKINPLKLSNRQRKGKVFPEWFPELYKYNENIAIELARALLKILQTKNWHSAIPLPFKYLSQYIIKNNLTSLSDIDLKAFDEVMSSVVHSRPRATFMNLKELLLILPSINNEAKLDIQSAHYKKPQIDKSTKSIEERIAASNLNSDYSDFVMFQIYAYGNACLSEINETITQTEKYIREGRNLSFFTNDGDKTYANLIQNGDTKSYDEAIQIELADSYKINSAIDLLKKQLSKDQYGKFKEQVNSSNYADLIASDWPLDLRENNNVFFLCSKVIPLALKNSNSNKNTFFKQLMTTSGIRIESILSCFNTGHNSENSKKYLPPYNQYKDSKYFIFSCFYDVGPERAYTGEGLHNVVLGRSEQFDFLLLLIIAAESGRNKEVVMSIPNYIGKTHILENDDLFATEDSVEMMGSKKRGHAHRGAAQIESFSVPRSTPLFQHLSQFNNIRECQLSNRITFFSENDFFKKWASVFAENTDIKNQNGSSIKSLDSTKFRKVFAGEMLLNWISNIKNKDDLIRQVAADLENFIPLVYLLQSSSAESMMATAIVGLQMRFVEHHLQVAANLKFNESPPKSKREKRFLCDCTDPSNPDYADNLNVDFCKQYDNCLGCSRAEVYAEHIPNIIFRCFQYEEILQASRDLYDANYAVKHLRANQVLDTFKSKTSHGNTIHADAFNKAYEAWQSPETYLLPPLIHINA
ncbi:hypothetical protein [Pseudoalteromonas sp. bablab_jr004]|uniref:hypothetical protein n=1 Tax=Pseudoalteromonas sp. bablab_jr004 TaxID=2755065 RepID=UPI0018F32CF9|nr:hypothetical protein [Pseudoalteromonas sp. bablab_jr004]